MMRCGFTKWELLVVAAISSFVVVSAVCAGFTLPLELVFYVFCGWILFLWRVLPNVTVNWTDAGVAVVALSLFVFGTHWFLRWLYAALPRVADVAKPADSTGSPTTGLSDEPMIARSWSARWTASVVALVLMMFVAGIAMVGITHQLTWLAKSREPIVGFHDTASRRIQSTNNLKQIGLGFHNYHDRYSSLPAGGTGDAKGRMLHGWQTALLPFIEQEPLFDQVVQDKPWDDAANAKVFQTILKMYLYPVRRTPIKNESGYALSHYSANIFALGGTRGRTLDEFTDGTSNTLLAGEVAANFKPWGHPANWRDPTLGINRSPDGFGSPWPGGATFLRADGSVKFYSNNIDPQVLKALSTPAGGERADLDRE